MKPRSLRPNAPIIRGQVRRWTRGYGLMSLEQFDAALPRPVSGRRWGPPCPGRKRLWLGVQGRLL